MHRSSSPWIRPPTTKPVAFYEAHDEEQHMCNKYQNFWVVSPGCSLQGRPNAVALRTERGYSSTTKYQDYCHHFSRKTQDKNRKIWLKMVSSLFDVNNVKSKYAERKKMPYTSAPRKVCQVSIRTHTGSAHPINVVLG